ncbi:MAG: GAF domain-containing SpoIIE family protein phosphatase [Chthoniobacterales bacterium]
MWNLIFFALFITTLCALIFILNRFTRRISELEHARSEIQVEEDRVFEFLHGLGEAFSEGVRSSTLHRLIVEGAVRILDAHGGALYLTDRADASLVPAFITKGCPPLVEVPEHITTQAASVPLALESHLRLRTVSRGEGVIGEAWQNQEAQMVNRSAETTTVMLERSNQADAMMVAPLVYRRKTMGMLAVANGPMSTAFSKKDFEVFKKIAEQSAFALYNEIVYVEANEKRRMDNDLRIAREIQSILLPSESPKVEGYQISGINIPASQVSGDYYDYLAVEENKIGVAIADVSGKGVPASLIMAMCRSVLRSKASGNTSAADVLHQVNRLLYPDIKEDMFISMAYLIIDSVSGKITLSRAGHDAPMLYRARTKQVEVVKPPGMALGIDSGDVFDRVCADFVFEMEPGDLLLLYTDGATEALDENGLEFGLPKLTQGIQASAPMGAPLVIRRLSEDLKNFSGNFPQHDDITLIAIQKL